MVEFVGSPSPHENATGSRTFLLLASLSDMESYLCSPQPQWACGFYPLPFRPSPMLSQFSCLPSWPETSLVFFCARITVACRQFFHLLRASELLEPLLSLSLFRRCELLFVQLPLACIVPERSLYLCNDARE